MLLNGMVQLVDKAVARDILKNTDSFLFDCDGVLWHGTGNIKGASETVQKLLQMGKHVFYVTNNSSKTRAQVVEKCNKMGFPAKSDDIICTAYASALYLKSINFSEKVYMVGNPGMAQELDLLGIKHIGIGPDTIPVDECTFDDIVKSQQQWLPDPEVKCVLVGFDAHISYRKIMKAATYASNPNNLFLATNEDPVLPTGEVIVIPGAGCIVGCVKIASRRQPAVIGKPTTAMFDLLQKVHGLRADKCLMVGDSLNTDIAMAVNCNIRSLLVLTGVDNLENVAANQTSEDPLKRKIVPNLYIGSIGDFGKLIDDISIGD